MRWAGLLLVAACGRFGFEPRADDATDATDATGSMAADGPGPAFTALDVGGEFTCGIFERRAYCWGRNASGELGTGDLAPHATPTAVALPAVDVIGITAGTTHACALLADGTARCWGAAALGDGITSSSPTPVQVAGIAQPITEVSAAYDFTCAIGGGNLYCWGDDSGERLGNGAAGSTAVPVQILAGPVRHVFTGGDHACAVLATGIAHCWGHNDGPGSLGRGSDLPANASTPAPVVDLTQVTDITIAGYHACAIDSGAAWCWGTGSSGELGNGGTATTNRPAAVSGMTSGVTAIHTGGGPTTADTVCAVASGALWCWGAGDYGRPGAHDTNNRTTPGLVPGLADVTGISVGWYHACAIAGADAMCWGRGDSGQLGDGGTATSYVPVRAIPPMP